MSDKNVKFNATKYYFMTVAEVLDAYRTMPRMLVAGYSYLVWDTVQWFQALPAATSQHTFLVSTVVGGAAAVFGLYVNSGASWDKKSADKHHFIETSVEGSSYNTQLPPQQHHHPHPQYSRQQGRRQNPVMEMERRPTEQLDMEIPPADYFPEN